jgi:lysophospholipase L1-like esterase
MLVRFRNDVINLEPRVVVILAGTNDVAENNGPTSLENIAGNIASMAELAKAHHIKVVICSVLPATDFWWHKGLEPAGKIIRLNEMLKAYAMKNHFSYVDYHSEMKDATNGLDKKYSDDGVHPTPVGYRKMEEILERTLVQLDPGR